MELKPGARLGPYEIVVSIGAGGMGEIFRAVDTRLHRTVAVKLLSQPRLTDPAHRSHILREARAASALNHPNIVVLYDISSHDGIDFLVMEHVEGKTLRDLIPAEGMALDTVAELGAQVASALASAHAAGIVHRDIKPANIMVTPQQQVKILDFGIAKFTAQIPCDSNAKTQTLLATIPGMVVGTISYMSPEQMNGDAVDGRSDIFSLGCVLYEAATGQLPFRGNSMLAVMNEILGGCPAAPSSLRRELPRAFDHLVAACLEKSPSRRPASACEIADELKSISSLQDRVFVRSVARRSIAVIPFRFRAAPPEDQFLSVALAEAVENKLGVHTELMVRPTASVLRYAGTDIEWPVIARELNVDLVVEGTIQKMGTRIRVLLQVHQASDSRTLHSFKQDGDAGDLFGIQDRIADSVSDIFAPRTNMATEPAAPPTKNPLAYELYMRACERVAHVNQFDVGSAIELLCRAVELDANFADAWGRLAHAYSVMGMHLDADPVWFERAEHAITMTLNLDPVQCDALCARGQILWSPSRGFQNQAALRAINAALRVNPSRHVARQFRSVILFHLGYYDQAQRDSELASSGHAMDTMIQGAIALYRGDYSFANELYRRTLSLDPALVLGNIFAPLAPLYLGLLGEAREKLQRARQMVPEEPQLTSIEALLCAYEGDFRRAEQLADESCAVHKSVTHTHHTWHSAAGAYAIIGRNEKALTQLRHCAEMGLPNYRLFNSDPHLRTLREVPEFTSLMSDLRRQHDQLSAEIDMAGVIRTD